jgi:hypothetical protein
VVATPRQSGRATRKTAKPAARLEMICGALMRWEGRGNRSFAG